VDIAPTLLQFLNIPLPGSFRGQALYRTNPGRRAIAEQPNIRWAVYSEGGLYIYQRNGEESFQGRQQSLIPELRKIVQDLIAGNLYNGIVFAFSGSLTEEAKIVSDQPFRRAYLFGGEPEDRIEIGDTKIQLKMASPTNDVDYVFVEPQPDSTVTAEGFSLRDHLKQSVNSSFQISDVKASPVLPVPKDFSLPGCIVIRRPGTTTGLELSEEQKEELKSIGYMNN
jgi:hypothetical protein